MTPAKPKGFDELLKESAAQGGSEASAPADDRVRPKFAQIRPSQWNGLDALARDLMDSRTGKGRRITANTLIRVAIDALLAQEGLLVGNDEDELRANYFKSLGIRDTKTREDQD